MTDDNETKEELKRQRDNLQEALLVLLAVENKRWPGYVRTAFSEARAVSKAALEAKGSER